MFDRLQLLNSVDRSNKYPDVTPRAAASLLLIDRSHSPYKILMGLRHQKSSFMPDVFVFPGGGLEPQDLELANKLIENCSPELATRCSFYSIHSDAPNSIEPHSASSYGLGLALCAVRELYEETGLHLGAAEADLSNIKGHPLQNINVADLFENFIFLSRAITPPGRKKRYDTRFFMHDYNGENIELIQKDDELVETLWVSYDEAISLKIHPMTRVILEDLHEHLDHETAFQQANSIAFYHYVRACFQREFLEIKTDT